MMYSHQQEKVLINDKEVLLDIEMIDVVKLLNKLDYKTSGCCIGDYKEEDNAWVLIQESDEKKMIALLQNIKSWEYTLTKRINYINSKDILVYDYVLETPKVDYIKRLKILGNWYQELNDKEKIEMINQYKVMNNLDYWNEGIVLTQEELDFYNN